MYIIKRFLKFIEITTKIASFVPFLIGLAYVFYLQGRIDVFYSAFFAVDIMLFDLPVTMINNYLDKRRSGESPHFSKMVSLTLIISMTSLSILMGLYLTYVFGPIILFTGILCFFTGIFYSATPICLSRTPYGEIFSGLVQGFCITFMIVFINLPKGYLVDLQFANEFMQLQVNMLNMIRLVLVTLPAVFCISAIMLANNICDVERDTKVNRFTLPYYIGKDLALKIYRLLYIGVYAVIYAAIFVKALPLLFCGLMFVTLPFVMKNVTAFTKKPEKSTTFILSLKNFILILIPYMIAIFLGRLV
ncbi:MAG: UbiA family prenyltransferase [Clostridiales bacterium]|jgi:1,4-dihydroxy-2-naphthoate octaprenyltransferase|nr:UbiA family prenyltransferase [Clostridiales bacterium]